MFAVRVLLLALLLVPITNIVAMAECTYTSCNFRSLGLTEDQWKQLRASAIQLAKDNRKAKSPYRAAQAAAQPVAVAAVVAQGVRPPLVRNPPSQHLRFYLRQDFEDIGVYSAATETADEKVTGAEFSWARDRIAQETTWSAKATAAASYHYIVEDIYSTSPLLGFAVGPYFGINREVHSRNNDENVDIKTYGLSSEAGWKNLFFDGSRDYVRFRFAGKQDDIKNTTIAHGSFDWIPVWLSLDGPITTPFGNIQYSWMPELTAQYDETNDAAKPIAFSDKPRSFRIGPQAVLWFKLNAPQSPLQWFFEKTTARVVYHWWTETYSGKSNDWLDASISHRLDPQGFVALKFAYRRGRDEDTGVRTDLFKIALSAKTCVDVYSKDAC